MLGKKVLIFMANIETFKNIPEDELRVLIQDYQEEGAQVSVRCQDDGLWTITAFFNAEDKFTLAQSPAYNTRYPI